MSFEVDAVVEIPTGSMYKYEVDKATGFLTVNRPLVQSLPYNYGYVPNTLHGDGDPLDICIVGGGPIYPLARVKVVLIGAFICSDNGESDHKLVAHVVGNTMSGRDVENSKEAVKYYLETYKAGFNVDRWVDPEEAYAILMKDIEAYINE